MNRLIPLFGSHFMILLGGMSEKTRKPLSLIQQHPSDQSKPLPSTSIIAPCGTSLSNAGSIRSMEPMVLGVWALADEISMAAIVMAQMKAVMGLVIEWPLLKARGVVMDGVEFIAWENGKQIWGWRTGECGRELNRR